MASHGNRTETLNLIHAYPILYLLGATRFIVSFHRNNGLNTPAGDCCNQSLVTAPSLT